MTTVGILGGGQLGRMLALAGAPLGLRFLVLDSTADACAAQFAPLSSHPRVRCVRRQGMIFAWDVSSSLPDFARRCARHALDHGLLLRPIGHTLYAMPPYVIDEAEGAFLAAGALAALQATLAEEEPCSAPALQGVCDGV